MTVFLNRSLDSRIASTFIKEMFMNTPFNVSDSLTDIALIIHRIGDFVNCSHWVISYLACNPFLQWVGERDCTSVQVRSLSPRDAISITFL